MITTQETYNKTVYETLKETIDDIHIRRNEYLMSLEIGFNVGRAKSMRKMYIDMIYGVMEVAENMLSHDDYYKLRHYRESLVEADILIIY